ncbi:MAG: class I adenylate-forming enzyme family protein [Pseudomonadales bacterium]|nr:class I adenylate-forming enzyme family protein [Pseudomonadales bacterium]
MADLLATLPHKISSPLLHWAKASPGAVAVRDHLGNACTYAELAERVRQAQIVLAAHGIGPDARVLLLNENSVSLVVLILALSELGAWSVIVNARMSASEIKRIRDHAEPEAVVYLLDSRAAQQHWQALGDHPDAAGKQLELNLDLGLQTSRLGIEINPFAQTRQRDPQSAAVAALIYTTGTTGAPKGVMLSHRNILYVAAVTSKLRGMQASDRIYAVLPISHVFGLAAVFLASLYMGAELVLADRFDPEQTMETLRVQGITGLFGVPAMYARLLEYATIRQLKPTDMPRLRFMYSGGAPLDPVIKAKTEELFGLRLLNAYGMTESGPTICQVRCDETPDSCTVGRPLPGLDIKVLGVDGKEVEPGAVGELHVRGPNIMLGYFRNPEATAAVLDQDGFLNTGDLVRCDEQGNMHIAGRSKELIIHSGFNVYPPEVEAVLAKHPDVTLCAVIGEEHAGNEEVVAFVQRAPGSTLSAQALQEYIKADLAAYKRPGRIVFMEQLPTAPSGKVLKHRLSARQGADG